MTEKFHCGRNSWQSAPRQGLPIDKTRLESGLQPLFEWLEDKEPGIIARIEQVGVAEGHRPSLSTGFSFVGDKHYIVTKESEISKLALKAVSSSLPTISRHKVGDFNFFKDREGLQNYADLISHKAIVRGFPAACTGYEWVSGMRTPLLAARAAMQACMSRIDEGATGVGANDCGCRLVSVDDRLFVDPSSIDAPLRTGWELHVAGKTGATLSGTAFWKRLRCDAWSSFEIVSADESNQLCSGQYKVNCDSMDVTMNGSCFSGQQRFSGQADLDEPYSTYSATGSFHLNDGENMVLKFGSALLK